MIDQKEGETNFAVKIHYDEMVSIIFLHEIIEINLSLVIKIH